MHLIREKKLPSKDLNSLTTSVFPTVIGFLFDFYIILNTHAYLDFSRYNEMVFPFENSSSLVYSFSTTAAATHHKLSGLKQHKVIILQFWSSTRVLLGKNQVSAGLHSLLRL